MAMGALAGIAKKSLRGGPMVLENAACVDLQQGIAGDCHGRGGNDQRRQITLLSQEQWQEACRDAGAVELPWVARRANFLVRGLRFSPDCMGKLLHVGLDTVLEVTGETAPCRRMDDAYPGLQRALAVDWRGGATSRVLEGGIVRLGDPVRLLTRLQELAWSFSRQPFVQWMDLSLESLEKGRAVIAGLAREEWSARRDWRNDLVVQGGFTGGVIADAAGVYAAMTLTRRHALLRKLSYELQAVYHVPVFPGDMITAEACVTGANLGERRDDNLPPRTIAVRVKISIDRAPGAVVSILVFRVAEDDALVSA